MGKGPLRHLSLPLDSSIYKQRAHKLELYACKNTKNINLHTLCALTVYVLILPLHSSGQVGTHNKWPAVLLTSPRNTDKGDQSNCCLTISEQKSAGSASRGVQSHCSAPVDAGAMCYQPTVYWESAVRVSVHISGARAAVLSKSNSELMSLY